jgi:hypothetical protein
MSIATVSSAWCAYQSAVFGNLEEFALHDAENTNRAVISKRTRGNQNRMVDVNLFTNWANAHGANATGLEQFYVRRFPPRLKTAFQAWMTTSPFSDSSAPIHPFVMEEYKVLEEVQADSLDLIYHQQLETAVDTNSHSEHYILLTVVFASVLFLGGITSNIGSLQTKMALVFGSAIVLFASVLWMLTFPMMLR